MKTRKTYGYMSFILLPIVLFASLAFFKHFPSYLLYPYRAVNALYLFIAVFLVITPWGGLRIDDEQCPGKHCTPINLWARISLLQISLCLVFFAMHTLIFKSLPVHTSYIALTPTITTFWQKWPLYPWSIIASTAAGLAYTCYNLRESAFISNLTQNLLHNASDSFTTHLIGIFTRNAVSFSIAATLGIYILLATSALTGSHPDLIATGANTTAYIAAILVGIIVILPFFKGWIAKLMRRQLPSIIGMSAFILLSAVIVLIISSVVKSAQLDPGVAQTPEYYKDIIKLGDKGIWMLFATNWWLGFAPCCALIIARWCKGYNIRTIILTTLSTPALLALLSLAPQYSYSPSLNTSLLLASLGFVIFFSILCYSKNRDILVQMHVPALGKNKPRDFHFFFRRSFRISGVVIFMYLPIGIMYITLTLYITNIFMCGFMALAGISFMIGIVRVTRPPSRP